MTSPISDSGMNFKLLEPTKTKIDRSTLPKPTQDIEQGKQDLDRFGYAIHEDILSQEELNAIRLRLTEQADR